MAPRKSKASAAAAPAEAELPTVVEEIQEVVEEQPDVVVEAEEPVECEPSFIVDEGEDEDDEDEDDEDGEYDVLTTAVGQLAQLLMTEEGEAITDVLSGLRDAIDKQNKILYRGVQLLERQRPKA